MSTESHLAAISKHLKRIADALEKKNGSSPSEKQTKQVTKEWVESLFSEEQKQKLTITDEGSFVKAKAEFLQSDKFAELARIVENNGGEYVSAKKESHFRFNKGGS